MSYSLDVKIAPTQLQWLVTNGYKLHVARKMDKVYTVIWETKELTEKAKLSWREEFQTAWATKVPEDLSVTLGCAPVTIGYGQTVNIKDTGVMEPATGVIDESGKLTVVNNSPKPVNIVVRTKVGGQWKVLFVTTTTIPNGQTITMSPSIVFKLWFGKQTTSEPTAKEDEAISTEVTYSETSHIAIGYEGEIAGSGVWVSRG